MTLKETLKKIKKVDQAFILKASQRLDSLTKPRESLGRLEEFARRMVAITEELRPSVKKKIIFTFAADHGVAEEGVSAFPKEVTRQMVLNFLRGGAGINVLARHAGAEVAVVDIGVDCDFDEAEGLIRKKVVRGTRNIRKGPAMTPAEALQCVETGIELAEKYASKYSRDGLILGTGEMGIANTTPSSAVVAAFTGVAVAEITGRGTGIDDKAFGHKIAVIQDALNINKPNPKDPLDVLAKVGGAEIGGIAGLILGAASLRVPVVIDGFISTAGALIAYELNPATADYMFASHNSVEQGHRIMLDRIGLKPFVDLNLRLGEGTGSAIGISLIEAGLKIYNEMATFGEAGVSEEGS